MASKTADGVPEPTDQQTSDPVTAGTDETPKDDKAVDTRNDDPTINPAPNPGPGAPTGDSAVEAFPDQDEVLTSDPVGASKPKKSTQEITPSDQSGEPIEVDVVEPPALNSFVAFKTGFGYRIKRQGWIGPEALEVIGDDELKEFKKFVASL